MGKSIAQAALVIAVINMAGRLLGFLRETVIANQFGATSLTDAYLVAYTLPYFLQAVLGMALVSSIVPVVTKYLVLGREKEAWRIASITMNWIALFMLAFTVLGMAGARLLVFLTAPGFEPQTADLATTLTVIMFPSVIFMGVGMLITGVLNARKSFAVAAFAPGFSSIIIILSVLLSGRFGISYLAWGTLLSMVGALLIQLPALRRVGFCYIWDWDLRHPEVRALFLNLLPVFLGTAVNQLYLAINRIFASGLAEGSISALNYAGKMMNLPMGIFVLAVSSVIFPTLSEQSVKGDRVALSRTLVRGITTVLLITLPASAGLMALKEPIIQLLFERGAFTAEATAMTAAALFYFSLGMFAVASNMILTRAYYALRDVRTPLYLGAASIAVDVAASILLIGPLGQNGLALANSLAAAFNAAALFVCLRRYVPELQVRELLSSIGKSLAAALLTALAAVMSYRFMVEQAAGVAGSRQLFCAVAVSITLGVIVYAGAVLLLREREAVLLCKKILRR
jgi:putative peptidoglycan lipid II flippase